MKAFGPGIGLPPRPALPTLSAILSPPETTLPICKENHHLGPASRQLSKPGQLPAAHDSQVQTKQDQQPTGVTQSLFPGAKATRDSWSSIVGSDSESRFRLSGDPRLPQV